MELDDRICRTLYPTPFGRFALVWSLHEGQPRIRRIHLPGSAGSDERREDRTCAEIDRVAGEIRAFLSGESIRFTLEIARMDLCPDFQRRLLLAEHAIPRGRVSTYARIAAHLGVERGARAVGSALAANPFPILIPCHRAIRSDRTLGGYQGGLEMKRTLLEMEGLSFESSGRVSVQRFYY
jgi:methylated-DNA-[protein]-cysteine S-methyltransferase